MLPTIEDKIIHAVDIALRGFINNGLTLVVAGIVSFLLLSFSIWCLASAMYKCKRTFMTRRRQRKLAHRAALQLSAEPGAKDAAGDIPASVATATIADDIPGVSDIQSKPGIVEEFRPIGPSPALERSERVWKEVCMKVPARFLPEGSEPFYLVVLRDGNGKIKAHRPAFFTTAWRWKQCKALKEIPLSEDEISDRFIKAVQNDCLRIQVCGVFYSVDRYFTPPRADAAAINERAENEIVH